MTRSQLVDTCKELIREAYEHATETIVAYLEENPNEPRATLCKEIDPDNWKALDHRVARLQQKRRSEGKTGTTSTTPSRARQLKHELNNRNMGPNEKADLIGQAIESDPELFRATIAKVGQVAAKGIKRQTKEIDADVADTEPTHKATQQENAKAALLMKWLIATGNVEEVADLVRNANPDDFTEEERDALRDGFNRIIVAAGVVEMAITKMEVTQ